MAAKKTAATKTKKVLKVEATAEPSLHMHMPVPVPIHELNPVAYNPNKMTPEKYDALKESILKNGFLDPIIVQKNGMHIIGGHHRLKALKEICVEHGFDVPEVPCIILDLDDVEAKKLNLKLNHIKGEPDARLLGEMLVDLFPAGERIEKELAVEIPKLGFTMDEARKFINTVEPDAFKEPTPPELIGTFGKSVTLSLEFTDVRTRDQIRKLLQHRVEMEKKKSGDIVASILAPEAAKEPKKKAAKN